MNLYHGEIAAIHNRVVKLMPVAIFIGTMKGAFLLRSSTSLRNTWELEGPLFKGWQVTAACRAPDGRFVAATSSFVYGTTLHISDDFREWKQVEHGPGYAENSGRKLKQVWTLANTPLGMVAGVNEAGLFRATDPMGPWEPIPGINDHPTRAAWQPGLGGLCAHVVLANPDNPQQLWCGISAVGVFRSDDGGDSWQLKNNGISIAIPDKKFSDIGFCVHGLTADPNDPQTLYRQDHLGMYRSLDGGDSWHKNEEGLPSSFGFPIKTDPHTGTLFCYGNYIRKCPLYQHLNRTSS